MVAADMDATARAATSVVEDIGGAGTRGAGAADVRSGGADVGTGAAGGADSAVRSIATTAVRLAGGDDGVTRGPTGASLAAGRCGDGAGCHSISGATRASRSSTRGAAATGAAGGGGGAAAAERGTSTRAKK